LLSDGLGEYLSPSVGGAAHGGGRKYRLQLRARYLGP